MTTSPELLTGTTELTVTFRVRGESFRTVSVAERIAETLRSAFDAVPQPVFTEADAPEIHVDTVTDIPALHIHVPSRTVRLNGVRVPMTRMEFELLLYLGRGAGRVFSRQDLLTDVWRTTDLARSRTVDVHIRRLRAKLGDDPPVITTVRGVGYLIDNVASPAIQE